MRELLGELVARVAELELELAAETRRANALASHMNVALEGKERLAIVTAERNAYALELEAIRAERERAQARMVGHPSYGEGAVADGPGTPQTGDLRALVAGVDELVRSLDGR